jgi:hypothetical protein
LARLDKGIKQPQVVFLKKSSAVAASSSSTAAPGSPSLNSVHSLSSDEDDEPASSTSTWAFEGKVISPLAATALECPVGAFGDSADFDLNASHLTFTAKPTNLPPAWHTRQHVYVVPFFPRNGSEAHPRVLTGDVGATSSPVFSPSYKHAGKPTKGSLAWLEMRQDGYEADRASSFSRRSL